MSDTCVPSLIVIGTAINQLDFSITKNNLLPEAFVVVYKHVMF